MPPAPVFFSVCKALWGCSVQGTVGMWGTAWPALIQLNATWHALKCLKKSETHLSWRNWCAQRRKKWIAPRGAAGSRGKSGDIASLSLYRVLIRSQVYYVFTSKPLQVSTNCQNPQTNNPCAIVEHLFPRICLPHALSQQHPPSRSPWLLPTAVYTISLRCLNSPRHPHIICCGSDNLYCGCIERVMEMLRVGDLSADYPLSFTKPADTSFGNLCLSQMYFKLASELKSYWKCI